MNASHGAKKDSYLTRPTKGVILKSVNSAILDSLKAALCPIKCALTITGVDILMTQGTEKSSRCCPSNAVSCFQN